MAGTPAPVERGAAAGRVAGTPRFG